MPRLNNTRIGDVSLRDFDNGVYKTLMAEIMGGRYFLPVQYAPGVTPPLFSEYSAQIEVEGLVGEQMPGIPFIYGNPAAAVMRYLVPCIRLKREDPSPALERSHSKHIKYRAPADGQTEITVDYRGKEKKGYAVYEEQEGSTPVDIPYTITAEAAGKSARRNAHVLLEHCMDVFYPHEKLCVVDSLGRERLYQVHCEGPSELTQIGDVRDRIVSYALSMRVQAELDLRKAREERTVTDVPVVNLYPMSQRPVPEP